MKLLLWDIDGTLVCTGRAGDAALRRAVQTFCGVEDDLTWIDYRGRTDAWIAHQVLARYGYERTETALEEFLQCYLTGLADELPRRSGKVHPGIIPILEQVAQMPTVQQGLLTGNLVRGAELKLSHYRVWHYFPFGAFANDSANRNELGPVALRRATERYAFPFRPDETYIIGDTPNDIECGKVIGAQTIAVATGGFTVEQLAQHQPSAVFPDLSDSSEFFRMIGLPN